MTLSFIILSLLILAGGLATILLRNLVHCALALTVAFAGLSGVYLELGAQFVGFAQILVYIGAVAILVLFAILLTRGSESPRLSIFSPSWAWGVGVAVAVFGLLAALVMSSRAIAAGPAKAAQPTVRQLGDQLMTHFLLPLEVLGLLLTAALIGAVLLAMNEPAGPGTKEKPHGAAQTSHPPAADAAAGSSVL